MNDEDITIVLQRAIRSSIYDTPEVLRLLRDQAITNAPPIDRAAKEKQRKAEAKKAKRAKKRAKKISKHLTTFKHAVNSAVANAQRDGLTSDEMDAVYSTLTRSVNEDEKLGKALSSDSDSSLSD